MTDFENALKDAEKCIEINGGWSTGYLRKGNVLYAKKKYAEAIVAFEIGLEIDPEDTEIEEAMELAVEDQAEEENKLLREEMESMKRMIMGDEAYEREQEALKTDVQPLGENEVP